MINTGGSLDSPSMPGVWSAAQQRCVAAPASTQPADGSPCTVAAYIDSSGHLVAAQPGRFNRSINLCEPTGRPVVTGGGEPVPGSTGGNADGTLFGFTYTQLAIGSAVILGGVLLIGGLGGGSSSTKGGRFL